MRRPEMLAMASEDAPRRDQAIARFAQPVAALAALLAVFWGLADGFWPTWPLWTVAGLLVLGLLAGPLTAMLDHRAIPQLALPVAGLAALLVLSLWLPAAHAGGAVQPAWVIAFLLDLGLVADPLQRLASRRPVRWSGQIITSTTALLVLTWELAIDGWYFDTTPYSVHTDFLLPLGALRVVIVLLYLGLVGGQFARREAVRRLLTPVTTVAALVILLLTLATPPAMGISPTWSLWCMVGLLGVGLVVDSVVLLLGGSRVQVLSQRVDQLARTRRGALDVQATELRRIERDLHDGAQVRLVALSMKLGRAEDRYRDDPETAALLREAREDATAAIRELRELARGIAPPVLADRGLEAAVQSLAQRSGSEVKVSGMLERRPSPAVETAAYFVVAESLTNAAKHAPGARVEVCLDQRAGDLFVEITDFGPGGADPAGGGLTGLRQRVEALDGSLHVTSPAGVGTQVEAVISCRW